MNDWYPDLIVAERRMADLRAQAAHERLAASVRAGRRPLSLRIHLDLQLTLGRAVRSAAERSA
ncbi:MAG TPA: hypothetical protein VF160_13560 [Candidatus Dormibacteraeota bacterium]